MSPTPEQVSAVEAWLRRMFVGAHVASEGDFDREVQLFRARENKPSAPAHELEISYLAFEDHTADEIIRALEQHKAAERFREPHGRLFLNRSLSLGVSPPPKARVSGTASIRNYNLVEFASFEEAQLFVSTVMGYIGTPAGIKWMLDSPHRVVIWQRFRFPPRKTFKKDASTFYVSDGVLQLAPALGLSLPVTGRLAREKLPEDRSLLVGLQTDWHE